MNAFIKKGKVILQTRGNQDYISKNRAVSDAFKDICYDAAIDGEVVVPDENGNPDFSTLQNYREGIAAAFYAFDFLWCYRYDMMQLPLTECKDLLQEIITPTDITR